MKNILSPKAHMICWKLSKFVLIINIEELSIEWFEWYVDIDNYEE